MCANIEPPSREALEAAGLRVQAGQEFRPSVFPGQVAPIVTSDDPSQIHIASFGLVPHWAQPKLARMTYNARKETAETKPSFRTAWRNGQLAAVPAQAFFEPNYETGKAIRHAIRRKDGAFMWLAGLWERRIDDPGPTRMSFTLLTIPAAGHPIMGRMHGPEDEKRSVVVLDDAGRDDWISAKATERTSLLALFDENEFAAGPEPLHVRA